MKNIFDTLYEKTPAITAESLDIMNHPFKGYRTLYFNNNIDIRLCPKNANTSLKYIFCYLHYNKNMSMTFSRRKQMYEKMLYENKIENGQFLFRNNSHRIAIKRDPIDRALSAAKYILYTRLNLSKPPINLVEEVLNNIDFQIDHHLLPQSFWMGNSKLYNRVYNITEFNNLIKYLQDNFIWFGQLKDIHKNVSSNRLTVSDLSTFTINKLKKTYEIDYDNGWY